MKLYIYEYLMGVMSVEEHEAVEKPKSFIVGSRRFSKKDEGTLEKGWCDRMFLTERNDELFRQKLLELKEVKLQKALKEAEIFRRKIENIKAGDIHEK